MQRDTRRQVPVAIRGALTAWLVGLVGVFAASPAAAQFRVPESLTPEQAARFERFKTFQIKGVCGDRDLERLASFGVNTVRGYTIPEPAIMKQRLDEAHANGLMMVVSEWMPHHGENKGRNGGTWTYDYNESGDKMVEAFIAKIEGIGDHPAILMWGLGNEVHLDEPYLRTVERMSRAIHERFPAHITSLTMVNAKPEAIEAVKRFAPDLDVIGGQSYSVGAVRKAISNLEEHWGKPFYMSEFNGKGPWNFPKAEWGEPVDEPVSVKVSDLKQCYEAIDASPLCLGSTVFVWGHYGEQRPTYFSMLLDREPVLPARDAPMTDLLMTPQAEAMIAHFGRGDVLENHAPVLTVIEASDGERWLAGGPGATASVRLAATDQDGDTVTLRCWVLDPKSGRSKIVAGPFDASVDGLAQLALPEKAGEYLVIAYALDGRGGASASCIPLAVR